MQPHQSVDVQQLTFQQLPAVQNLANSGSLIENYIKGHNWFDSYNCITELRKINKYHPEFVPDIIQRFSQTILQLMSTGKTLLVKNILKLIKQFYDAGQQVNVQKAVVVFLPILIKKAATDIGLMKTLAQQVLTSFSCNCGYEVSITITAQNCVDKNASIAQLSVKLFEALIRKIGSGVMSLNENSLITLMKCLSILVDGKRQSISKNALDICIFICQSIGSENYLKLMQFCLKQEEAQSMGTQMENHRTNKQKPLGLKQAIKSRNSTGFNQNFFNENKLNNSFIPLAEKQMNYDNSYNTGYNNSNQYNNNQYSNQQGGYY